MLDVSEFHVSTETEPYFQPDSEFPRTDQRFNWSH